VTTMKRTVTLESVGIVEISTEDYGEGQPFLLLHGGGGPDTVTRFAAAFAEAHPARVFAPVHPGFAVTPRPEGLDSLAKLAALYLAMIEDLELEDVTVVGNSIGGWITAEMALLESSLVSGIVLIDAVGIDVPGHPVADFFTLSYEDFLQRAFHNPEPFRVDPASLPEQAQQAMAANREALTIYTGHQMSDPGLAERLGTLEIPTLVLWGGNQGRQGWQDHRSRALTWALGTLARLLATPADACWVKSVGEMWLHALEWGERVLILGNLPGVSCVPPLAKASTRCILVPKCGPPNRSVAPFIPVLSLTLPGKSGLLSGAAHNYMGVTWCWRRGLASAGGGCG
jgi:pimeloyl-ACP methyl ester carboxylesterase